MILFDGSYQRIELEIRPSRSSSNSQILNRSILLLGTWADGGGTSYRVEFEMRRVEDIILQSDQDFVVDADDPLNSLLVRFPLGAWFENVDLENAVRSRGQEIRINETENPEIYASVIENITNSVLYGEDQDDDGELDDEEFIGTGEEGRTRKTSQGSN